MCFIPWPQEGCQESRNALVFLKLPLLAKNMFNQSTNQSIETARTTNQPTKRKPTLDFFFPDYSMLGYREKAVE